LALKVCIVYKIFLNFLRVDLHGMQSLVCRPQVVYFFVWMVTYSTNYLTRKTTYNRYYLTFDPLATFVHYSKKHLVSMQTTIRIRTLSDQISVKLITYNPTEVFEVLFILNSPPKILSITPLSRLLNFLQISMLTI